MAKLDYVKEAVVKRNPNDGRIPFRLLMKSRCHWKKSQINIRNISKKAYSKECRTGARRSSSVYSC